MSLHVVHYYSVPMKLIFGEYTVVFFYFIQICVNSLQTQCVPVDEFEETNSTSASTSPTLMSTQDKIDVRSCVQFLMELFEQWVSPYTQPKTPLMLLTQSVKSVSFSLLLFSHRVSNFQMTDLSLLVGMITTLQGSSS